MTRLAFCGAACPTEPFRIRSPPAALRPGSPSYPPQQIRPLRGSARINRPSRGFARARPTIRADGRDVPRRRQGLGAVRGQSTRCRNPGALRSQVWRAADGNVQAQDAVLTATHTIEGEVLNASLPRPHARSGRCARANRQPSRREEQFSTSKKERRVGTPSGKERAVRSHVGPARTPPAQKIRRSARHRQSCLGSTSSAKRSPARSKRL